MSLWLNTRPRDEAKELIRFSLSVLSGRKDIRLIKPVFVPVSFSFVRAPAYPGYPELQGRRMVVVVFEQTRAIRSIKPIWTRSAITLAVL